MKKLGDRESKKGGGTTQGLSAASGESGAIPGLGAVLPLRVENGGVSGVQEVAPSPTEEEGHLLWQ